MKHFQGRFEDIYFESWIFKKNLRITIAIFLSVAALFEDVGLVRPSGEDHLIILSKFLIGKDSSATEESFSSLERILTEVELIILIIYHPVSFSVTSKLLRKSWYDFDPLVYIDTVYKTTSFVLLLVLMCVTNILTDWSISIQYTLLTYLRTIDRSIGTATLFKKGDNTKH